LNQLIRILAAGAFGLIGVERAANAQVCTEPTPGVASIQTTTPTTFLKTVRGTTRANTVNCGFLATSIVVTGQAGEDTLSLLTIPATVAVTANLAGGPNRIIVNATAGDDTIVCGASSVDRDGSGEADLTIGAGPVRLVIRARDGVDLIDCTAYAGPTHLLGGAGDDVIRGGSGPDMINGGDGDDQLAGNAGDDGFLQGSVFDGNDQIAGGTGTDTVSYAQRTDEVYAGLEGAEDAIGDDVERITGGAASDTLDFSSSGTGRTIRGGGGNDLVRGSDLADQLYGGLGDDTILGGGGADELYGDGGDDNLDGQAGTDSYAGGAGNDTIMSDDGGAAEDVRCGAGIDDYVATADTFTDCETASDVVPLTNGSFETGDYTGWTVFDEVIGEADIWGIGIDGARINTGDVVHDHESGGDWSYNCGGGVTPVPTDGGAVSIELQQYGSYHRLYQDLTVPDGARALWFSLGYERFGTFDAQNQFIAVTLRDPTTDAVLSELFKTAAGGTTVAQPMANLHADVSAFAGQAVRVDVEVSVYWYCMPVQFDNFRFLAAPAAFAPRVVEPVDDADEGGCSTTGGSGIAAGLLVGLALLARRRRRA
jgi:uncharacterized protein (TIGR03382 family)